MPSPGGYWLCAPSWMAATAACSTSAGPSVSGNPWPRLTLPVATASADISAKIVVPNPCIRATSGSTTVTPASLRAPSCGTGSAAGAQLRAVLGGENHLAQTHRRGGDLDALVLAAELQRLLEGQLPVRDEPHQLLARGRADVGELLLPGGVDVHVVRAGIFADDHAFVHLRAGADEYRASLLEAEQRICRDRAAAIRDERPGRAGAQFARPRLVSVEHVMQQA